MAWMGSLKGESRSVILNTTFDGGATWSGAVALGSNIGWLGPVRFSPVDTQTAYIVYTQPEPGGTNAVVFSQQTCDVMVGMSIDGGVSWIPHDTGARIVTNLQGGHWSCVNMAPSLAVTGDGHVVAVWSEDVESPGDATSLGAVVKAVAADGALAKWGSVFTVTDEATAIMPWAAGGAGDRFAVSYFASLAPGDADYVGGVWDLKVAVVDGLDASAKIVRTLVDDDVHEGGICSRGGSCLLTGSDRFLLDFFQNTVMPDGRLAIVYPANPATAGRNVEVRFALQSGGTPLLAKAAPASQG
jgi:hypothetical protein